MLPVEEDPEQIAPGDRIAFDGQLLSTWRRGGRRRFFGIARHRVLPHPRWQVDIRRRRATMRAIVQWPNDSVADMKTLGAGAAGSHCPGSLSHRSIEPTGPDWHAGSTDQEDMVHQNPFREDSHSARHVCKGCYQHRSVYSLRGVVRARHDHDLCPRCFRSFRERFRRW